MHPRRAVCRWQSTQLNTFGHGPEQTQDDHSQRNNAFRLFQNFGPNVSNVCRAISSDWGALKSNKIAMFGQPICQCGPTEGQFSGDGNNHLHQRGLMKIFPSGHATRTIGRRLCAMQTNKFPCTRQRPLGCTRCVGARHATD